MFIYLILSVFTSSPSTQHHCLLVDVPPPLHLLSHHFYVYKLTQLHHNYDFFSPLSLSSVKLLRVCSIPTPLATMHLGLLSCVFSPMCSSSSVPDVLHADYVSSVGLSFVLVEWVVLLSGHDWQHCGLHVWGLTGNFFFHVCDLIFSFCCLFLQPVVPPADVTTGTFTHLIRCSLPWTQTQTHSSDVASDNGRRDLRNVLCFSFVQWHKKRKEKLDSTAAVDDTVLKQRDWS